MLGALRKTLSDLDPRFREEFAISAEADSLEMTYGQDAVEWVRMQIASARRDTRAHLYRVHDELARRHAVSA